MPPLSPGECFWASSSSAVPGPSRSLRHPAGGKERSRPNAGCLSPMPPRPRCPRASPPEALLRRRMLPDDERAAPPAARPPSSSALPSFFLRSEESPPRGQSRHRRPERAYQGTSVSENPCSVLYAVGARRARAKGGAADGANTREQVADSEAGAAARASWVFRVSSPDLARARHLQHVSVRRPAPPRPPPCLPQRAHLVAAPEAQLAAAGLAEAPRGHHGARGRAQAPPAAHGAPHTTLHPHPHPRPRPRSAR